MVDWVKSYWYRIPNWIRNRYFLVITIFALLMIFFDTNNVFQLANRKQNLKKLNKQEQQYKKELVDLEEQQKAFENDQEALEKFAREEYKMKRDDEDVFVIIERETEAQ